MTDVRQRPSDHDTVEAGSDANDLVLVTFNERLHRDSLMISVSEERSGYDVYLVPATPD